MIDGLDARLIELLAAEPRIGVLEASRRLGVARGTVQARLDRLQARGVVTGYGPDIDPAALGYAVTAFVTLEIRQAGGHDPVARAAGGHPRGAGGAHHHRGRRHAVPGGRPRPTPTCSGSSTPIVGVDGRRARLHRDRARHAGALPGAAAGAHCRSPGVARLGAPATPGLSSLYTRPSLGMVVTWVWLFWSEGQAARARLCW